MLACKTELDSPAWRQGMVDALSVGCSLADRAGLRGGCLYFALLRRFTQLAPLAYRSYRRAHAILDDTHRIYPEQLSFWQWRTCAVDLADRINVSALVGCAAGDQVAQLRRVLLLTGGEMDEAASRSLVGNSHVCALVPDETDGQIDGYQLCCRLMYDKGLDGERFVGATIEYLFALWPEDYRRYRYRYAQHARQARVSRTETRFEDVGLRLEYRLWSALVCELHDEIRRCRRAGVKPSHKQRELSRHLLCHPGEPLPVLDWTAPPKLLAELSC
jgi:hypothetical protein